MYTPGKVYPELDEVTPAEASNNDPDFDTVRIKKQQEMATNGDLVTVIADDVGRLEEGNNVPGKHSDDSDRQIMTFNSMESKYDSTHGEQATLAEADWRIPSSNHEGSYIRFLRHIYFPLYAKYHVHICCGWLVIFIICVVYGPAFLSSTRSNLDLPAGTPSAAAVKAFQDNYPSASRQIMKQSNVSRACAQNDMCSSVSQLGSCFCCTAQH